MNTYRTDSYSDRSVYRRRIDTDDRLYHYREKGVKSRLPRLTAFKYEGQRAVLQDAIEVAQSAIAKATK